MPVQKRESPKTRNMAPGFQNSFNGVHTLVMGGLCSRGLADGGCVTVYKAEGYSAENPIMRVVTRAADGQEYEQLVDPASATRTEIDALAAYLVDEKKLDSILSHQMHLRWLQVLRLQRLPWLHLLLEAFRGYKICLLLLSIQEVHNS